MGVTKGTDGVSGALVPCSLERPNAWKPAARISVPGFAIGRGGIELFAVIFVYVVVYVFGDFAWPTTFCFFLFLFFLKM